MHAWTRGEEFHRRALCFGAARHAVAQVHDHLAPRRKSVEVHRWNTHHLGDHEDRKWCRVLRDEVHGAVGAGIREQPGGDLPNPRFQLGDRSWSERAHHRGAKRRVAWGVVEHEPVRRASSWGNDARAEGLRVAHRRAYAGVVEEQPGARVRVAEHRRRIPHLLVPWVRIASRFRREEKADHCAFPPR